MDTCLAASTAVLQLAGIKSGKQYRLKTYNALKQSSEDL